MHSLEIVQWNFTRRDHPGNPGKVSGSSLVSVGGLRSHSTVCYMVQGVFL